jgi:hypothetical protein
VVTRATAPAPWPPLAKPSSEPPPRLLRAVGIAGLALTGAALTVIGGMLARRPVQGGLVLAATLFEHESAAFGVHVPAA